MHHRQRMTRRAVLGWLAIGASSGVLAACGPSAPSAATAVAGQPTAVPVAPTSSNASVGATPTAPAATAPTTAAQPRAGGTLHFGQAVEIAAGGANGPSPLDGHYITAAPLSAVWLGYDTLIHYDNNFQPQPMLAESWDVSKDLKQLTFHLRKGVLFHTGREFTSDDVKYNLMRVRQPNVGTQFTNMSKWFTGVDAPDKYTVVLTSDQPRPAMFDLFELLNMVNKDITETPAVTTTSGGTGPFKFAEYVQGDHIRWTKNPDYWMSGRPYLDEVIVQFIGDVQSMVVQLEGGSLQAIDSPPARDAARLKGDANYRVLQNDLSGQYWIAVLNTTSGATQNKQVRQALNYAIDRQRFVDTALFGFGEVEDLPWLSNSPAYDGSKRTSYTFDLDKAKSLLAASGLSNITLDFVYNSVVPEIVSFGQMLQADLSKIGVTLNLKGVERAVYNDLTSKFQYGMLMSTSGFANLDPTTLPLVSRYWDPNNNIAGMNDNADYKQVLAAASTESDPAKRKSLLSSLNDLILDESFSLAISPAKHVTAMRASVNGVRWFISEALDYSNVWLSA
jgi:peptide/nickel transport system substrate-binding protein